MIATSVAIWSPWAQADVHCSTNHACIERVAKITCLTSHDPWHCRIYHRWRDHKREHILAVIPPAAPAISTRDLCVANREGGVPGALTYSTINWGLNTGNGYTGAYQFEDSTWTDVEHRMGVSWTVSAYLASSAEQTAAFDYWSARDPGAWPNTLPLCGG